MNERFDQWTEMEGLPSNSLEAPPQTALEALLDARRFDFANPPERPVPLFMVAGQSIATRGNIEAVQAQSKAGKTALIGAMFAAWLNPWEEGGFLGVTAHETAGGAIVHFDSEQSPYDHWAICATAMKRAGVTGQPAHLRSYCVTDLPMSQRLEAVRLELERAKAAAGSIFAVFIDGLADLCVDPNDSEEAFRLVAEMHRLAIQFDTAIFCVLHENEGSESSKMRGHLGSQLARKAETNLRLQKDGDGVTVVFSERSRHCYITKEEGPRFAWNDEAGMHMPVADLVSVKEEQKRKELTELRDRIFEEAQAGGESWTWVHEQIERIEGVKREGARRKFKDMRERGIIVQNAMTKQWRAK